ncbi:MAG: extracellular solute-binding protein [Synergistaceae bacterium]|jgi:sn-glycerol 3-phosphate transport system substrate-binding protein|nr:extracellular solute-binding protein [Synergistaceae bacterium]
MKKIVSLIAFIALAALQTAGWRSPGPSPHSGVSLSSGTASAAEGKTDVVLWNVFADNSDTGVFLSNAARDFTAENPEIKVTIVGQGGYDAVAERLEAAAASGTLPTLAIIEETFLGRFHPRAADLSKYVSKDTIDNYQKSLLASSRINGLLATLPFNRSTPVLYVNRTLFDRSGVKGAPSTWDEFAVMARKLSDPENGVFGAGICWDTDAWIFESVLYSFGGEIISPDNRTILFGRNDIAANVVKLFQNMYNEGVLFNPYIHQDDPWAVIGSAFLNGKVAMFLGSNGMFGTYEKLMSEAGYELQLQTHPAGMDELSVATGGGNIIMFDSATEAQKRAAGRLIEFLARDRYVTEYAALTGYLPTTVSSLETGVIKDLARRSPSYKIAYDQMRHAHRRPLTKNWKAIYKLLTEDLRRCLTYADTDAASAMRDAAAACQKILDENPD